MISSSRSLHLLLLALILVFTAAIRVHFLSVPLERDEGEYAYAGQQLLDGISPYVSIYHVKLPGIYLCYAVIMALFGETHGGIHLGLLLVNLATLVLVYGIAKRMLGSAMAALASAAAYALLSLSQKVQGFSANAEHFVLVFAAGGIFLLLAEKAHQKKHKLFMAGLLLGMAYVTKQHGSLFVAAGAAYLIYLLYISTDISKKVRLTRFAWFTGGVVLPFLMICGWFLSLGLFDKFWFWTFIYTRSFVSQIPFDAGMQNLKLQVNEIFSTAWPVILLAAAGAASLLWHQEWRQRGIVAGAFFIFSFLAVCPGYYFHPHYFTLAMPALAVLAGGGAMLVRKLLEKNGYPAYGAAGAMALVAAALFLAGRGEKNYLFAMNAGEVARTTYYRNPFPESLVLAKYLREHTKEGDRLAVIGSEPQIYFYAGRRSATGYIYTYEIVKQHPYALKMQEEMIAEIEKEKPAYILFVNIPTSWLLMPGVEKHILDWFGKYQAVHYEQAGITSIVWPQQMQSVYCWDAQGSACAPQSDHWIGIYRRRDLQ